MPTFPGTFFVWSPDFGGYSRRLSFCSLLARVPLLKNHRRCENSCENGLSQSWLLATSKARGTSQRSCTFKTMTRSKSSYTSLVLRGVEPAGAER
jgi:hypothetical protein